ncbi:aminotransferase class V-fold PLP-dependent enzyme [Candidatus Babeliales bacterium]|nr:aminotransferase class V-fold PLP-dependent enzyme [Candidatus Babeliales bacterium]
MDNPIINLASDNYSAADSRIIKAIEEVNLGAASAYGYDYYTEQAISEFKKYFGSDVDIYFVFNGTAANVLGLKTITNSYNSIICAESAHINVDECNASENFTGCKLIDVPTLDGKLTVNLIKKHITFGFEHHAQPKVIAITQTTEKGTVYTPEEIQILSDFAHKNNMFLHMDGARLANAAVYLGVSLSDITRNVGVDVLSFGGTKNGMLFGEAVIFFNKALSENFKYIRKQGMQLASKMRFISTQFYKILSDNLWHENALIANKMAKRLEKGLTNFSQIKITQKVESNSVFVSIPAQCIDILQKKYHFYIWDENINEVRLMTSFSTTEKEIDDFLLLIKEILK